MPAVQKSALDPQAILHKVIQYRSLGGVFGMSGILAATVSPQPARMVRIVLLLILGATVVMSAVRVATRDSTDSRLLILLGAFLLVGIVVLGPGYGPQYIAWYLPLLVLTSTSFDAAWRRNLLVWREIAVLTYLAEYMLLPSQGSAPRPRFGPFGREGALAAPAQRTPDRRGNRDTTSHRFQD